MDATKNLPLVEFIEVDKLFGRRSYRLDVPWVDGVPSRLMLIHGNNGSGKTTMLKLLWNTLSAADNQGHRTQLAKVPFERFKVGMSHGRSITVEKTGGLTGTFTVTLARRGMPDVVTEYVADENLRVRGPSPTTMGLSAAELRELEALARRRTAESRKRIQQIQEQFSRYQSLRDGEQEFLNFLADEVSAPLLLADDRSLYSDDVDLNRTREILSRQRESDKMDRVSQLVFIELRVTLRRVTEYLRGLTLGGQNDGSANGNAIYLDVLRQLVDPSGKDARDFDDASLSLALLEDIARVAPAYEEFGLVPHLNAEEFHGLLNRIRDADKRSLADRVLSPYLSSVRARLDALREAHDVLRALVPTVNRFLDEKRISFTPREGVTIRSFDGTMLEVESLSSGERQLIMLLCTTILARVESRIFIIDEPELSLGVDWQRNIMEALVGLVQTSRLQLIVATHSIEIISGRPESLVQMRAR